MYSRGPGGYVADIDGHSGLGCVYRHERVIAGPQPELRQESRQVLAAAHLGSADGLGGARDPGGLPLLPDPLDVFGQCGRVVVTERLSHRSCTDPASVVPDELAAFAYW